jgi:hypothetical protein
MPAGDCLRALDLPEAEVSDVDYTALMQHVGPTGYAHEAAALLGGDEIALKAASIRTDPAQPLDLLLRSLPNLAPAARLVTRVRVAGTAVVHARRIQDGYSRANWEVAAATAERLGLGEGVLRSLHEIYEWWNGRGGLRRLGG